MIHSHIAVVVAVVVTYSILCIVLHRKLLFRMVIDCVRSFTIVVVVVVVITFLHHVYMFVFFSLQFICGVNRFNAHKFEKCLYSLRTSFFHFSCCRCFNHSLFPYCMWIARAGFFSCLQREPNRPFITIFSMHNCHHRCCHRCCHRRLSSTSFFILAFKRFFSLSLSLAKQKTKLHTWSRINEFTILFNEPYSCTCIFIYRSK